MSYNYLHLSNTLLSDNVKRVYMDLMTQAVDPRFPLNALIKYNYKAKGLEHYWGVPLSDITGTSFGAIQQAGELTVKQAVLSMKKLYHRIRVDRLSDLASQSDTGAFMRLLTERMDLARTAIMRHIERQIVSGDTTGALGTVSSVTDNGGGNYDIVITSATFAPGMWRLNELVSFGTDSDIFRVRSVALDTRTINVVRDGGGSYVPLAADIVYTQRSKDQEMNGLKGAIEGSGSLYGITRQFGWESTKVTKSSVPLTEEALLETVYRIHQRCGEFPDVLAASYAQRMQLHRLAADKAIRLVDEPIKRVDARGREVMLGVFPAIDLDGKRVSIIATPHLAAGSVYFLNTSKIEYIGFGPGEFVPNDTGAIMQYEGHTGGSDTMSMIWAQYGNLFVHPSYQGGIVGLSTEYDSIAF